MTLPAALRAYVAHDDPATAMANLVALIVGWNGPFYPLYVVALAGWPTAAPAALTALAAPFFLAIPALARRSSLAGRFALPMVGTVNTVWCTKLFGTSIALELFLLPCIALAALLYRRGERPWLLAAAALPSAANFLPDRVFGTPIVQISEEAARRLAALNEGSVLSLIFVIAWQFATLLRTVDMAAGRVSNGPRPPAF